MQQSGRGGSFIGYDVATSACRIAYAPRLLDASIRAFTLRACEAFFGRGNSAARVGVLNLRRESVLISFVHARLGGKREQVGTDRLDRSNSGSQQE